VLTDVAVMLADGGEAVADIDVLRHQSSPLLGPGGLSAHRVAHPGLMEPGAASPRRQSPRPGASTRVAPLPHGVPASRVADGDLGEMVVLDVDATIVVAHSERESAAPTFKGSFGFHLIGVWCDNTTELLAAKLRPGNAGANTTADHIDVLTAAMRQIPRAHRKNLLVRADGAGASNGLLQWLTDLDELRGQGVQYSIGFALTEALRQAIMLVPATVWVPAMDADGQVRAGGDVAELTGLLNLSRWPDGMRVMVRRARPHPGA
jgi:Transposase DDE domain group 1